MAGRLPAIGVLLRSPIIMFMKRVIIIALIALLIGAAIGAGVTWSRLNSASASRETRLELELATARSQVEDWQGKAVLFEQRLLDEAQRLTDEYTAARDAVAGQLAEAKADAERLQEQMAASAEQFSVRARAIADEEAAKAGQLVSQIQEASEQQTQALRSVIDQQRQALGTKDQALAEAQTRVEKLDKQVRELTAQVKVLSEQVAALNGLKR